MARTVGIGIQNFEKVITNHYFYIDKTHLIKEWWESGDDVTLIMRPRRFGKTLNMNMLERFFSVRFRDQSQIFEELAIWKEEKYRGLQGTYPVIGLSFADIKETTVFGAKKRICQTIEELYNQFEFIVDSGCLNDKEKESYSRVTVDMSDYEAANSLKMLSLFLSRYYGKNVIVLLDEYDTPFQEAYVYGYWNELAEFIRSLFNSTFKTNPYLERALMTGITRISKESVFSDLNNPRIVSATTNSYTDSFGFTCAEVKQALMEYGLEDHFEEVQSWYDGFTFGQSRGIYNPWSFLNYLKENTFALYWANTSSNRLVEQMIQKGNKNVKIIMEDLLRGGTFKTRLDEQIVFEQLGYRENAVWSLLLASGYLKLNSFEINAANGKNIYELTLTNKEVRLMFEEMIEEWFSGSVPAYNDFIRAMLCDDVRRMNQYMNEVALQTFSFFDSGNMPSQTEPERFYHGFVLGLMVDLADRYLITSNRESGFGRYDVMLEPKNLQDKAFILEFKVQDAAAGEETLESTAHTALEQIAAKGYAAAMYARGIPSEQIRTYGFAFRGKQVLIEAGHENSPGMG